MGLTNNSVGIHTLDSGLIIKKRADTDKVIALAGNPNVGKSTIFNHLTGLNQHTGNWPGKTVSSAQGYCSTASFNYVMVDIPGTYSLMAHSAEEEVARNFICFGESNVIIVVCDATCLERNLNLVLQTLEISEKVIVCVNLLDEAKRKNIKIHLNRLSGKLGIPVIGTTARKKKSLTALMQVVDQTVAQSWPQPAFSIQYSQPIEQAIAIVEPVLQKKELRQLNSRWLSLKLLDYDDSLIRELNNYLKQPVLADPEIRQALEQANRFLTEQGIDANTLKDQVVSSLVLTAEMICLDCIEQNDQKYHDFDKKLDRLLTSKWTGYPVMLLLLALTFWLTMIGANYPSRFLSEVLFWFQDRLSNLFYYFHAPDWLHGALVLGVYRVLAWVVSVMLPPMAIFFPLFTLLEDSGYLPRIAYNLDKPFKKCCACGKQALTMCMGFGCNAAGIVGCRIIDSPRERLIAIITNNFVPCNGRFPTLITIIAIFFAGVSAGFYQSLLSALLLTGVIVLGVLITFAVSRGLSKTLLKGVPSSFTLELPPYRKPQIGKVIVRSLFDRTLFVLGRAAAIAAPAGLVIWVLANTSINNITLLNYISDFLNPAARLMGLDGVILMAFILGLPANEIVLPIIIMAYLSQGSLIELNDLSELKLLLTANGWTWITAVSTILFSLMHWPCSTALLTIKKETGSWKWTALSFLIPTAVGFLLCTSFTGIARFTQVLFH